LEQSMNVRFSPLKSVSIPVRVLGVLEHFSIDLVPVSGASFNPCKGFGRFGTRIIDGCGGQGGFQSL
jgi:hypothetical protein